MTCKIHWVTKSNISVHSFTNDTLLYVYACVRDVNVCACVCVCVVQACICVRVCVCRACVGFGCGCVCMHVGLPHNVLHVALC